MSLYNEAPGGAIYPTPVIGAMGLLDDVRKHASAGFAGDGDVVYLIGSASLKGDASTLAGSEYQDVILGKVEGQPWLDLDLEVKTQQACRDGIVAGIVRSAHDVSEGGLAVALAEAAILGERGVVVDIALDGRWDAALFGEAQSRIIVTVAADQTGELERAVANAGAPLLRLGTTGGDRVAIGDLVDLSLVDVSERWLRGFRDATQNTPPTTS